MVWPYDEDTLGAYGSVSQVPTNEWFGVNTDTGEWQRPGPSTLAGSAGLPTVTGGEDLGLGLDLTTPWAGVGQGYGVLSPGTAPIGQVTGLGLSPTTALGTLGRPSMRDSFRDLQAPPMTPWEGIARSVGMLSPQGRAILQASDQSRQQELQNRLTLRRQELQEAHNERAEIRDDFNSFMKLSEIKSKALRKLYTDRLVADMKARGKELPADFIEAFKNSGGEDAKAMLKFYQPLLQDLGLDPTAFAELVEQGGIKEVSDALTLAQKMKKDRTEQARLEAMDKIGAGGTLGDVSGVTQPAPAPGGDQRPRGYVESGESQPIIGSEKLTPSFTAKANEVATRLNMNPQDLLRIISFETGGTFNPAEKNRAGSGATGLIQFTEQTAKALGTTTEALAKMSPEQQLDYVEKYLTPYKGKLGNLKDAYLAVLKPASLGQGLDTPLFTKDKDGLAYTQNAGLDTGGKGHVTVGDALGAVMRTTTGGGTMPPAPDTRMQVAGPGALSPTTPAPSAADQAALTRLKEAIALKDSQIDAYTRVGGEEANRRADNAAKQRDVLQQQYNRLEDRLTETPRAVAKQTALQPLELAKQRAGAEVTLEAKMNEPIGTDNAIKMGLPAETKWKDVPKGTRVLDRPGEGVAKQLGEFKASHEGITRVIAMLDNPKAVSIVGTLLSSEDNAAFRRLAGEWISSVTPQERKFAAALVAEIAGIRNTISGQAVSAQEAEFLKPMLPSVSDPDVATVRAKLEVLQEWIARKHEGARTQLDELGFRTPKALERPAEKPPMDPNAQKAIDILKPKGK